MTRFTTFDEAAFHGQNPVAWLADRLREPGAVGKVLGAAALLLPQYGLVLRVLGAVFTEVRPSSHAVIEAIIADMSESDQHRLAELLSTGGASNV